MENDPNLTIKERREQKRQEKIERKESGEIKRTKNRLFLWIGVLLVLGGAVFGMIQLIKIAPPPVENTPVSILDSVEETDWIAGNKDAAITLIEYADFECPACAQFYPVLKEIKEEFKDDVRFVYRHFPLPQHPNGRLASRASEAAGVQGKFWEMHDMLYENQLAWAGKANAKSIFTEYAVSLGLNKDQFIKDFESKQTGEKIDAQYKAGASYGVNSTPNFYLNNTKIQPRGLEEFKQLIQNEITKKP